MSRTPDDAAAAAPTRGAARRKARPRDSAATSARILRVAAQEFAERGLHGARVDRIAARADVNKRMIYHYFGSKTALYLAVLEHAYERVRSQEQKLDLTKLEPVEAMRTLAEFTFDGFVRDPSFIQLLNGENLNRARVLRTSKKIATMHSPLIGMVADILKRGADAGVFRRGIDPWQMWISIAALGYFYFSNVHTLSVITAQEQTKPDRIAARRAHVVEVVLGFLRPEPR